MLRLCQIFELVLTIARTLPDWKPEPFPNRGADTRLELVALVYESKITQLSKQI